jgi:DNA polymerase-3 subunit epsilon/CBS domain-containing protein
VIVDIETTSLDVRKARIIEIGAVPLVDGKIERTGAFSTYVNPQEPIPGDSQVIHGISDEMVRESPGFELANKAYSTFVGDHLILGYSLGFDLAVFRAEHERAGLPWKPPRYLDVRDLVRLLNPPLPDFSLDKVAAWLGVEVHERHTATGDALITAEIFLALLPRLREAGIRTLAEAEEAARQHMPAREVPSGWIDTSAASAAGALARVDSYPYRYRVHEVMTAPPRMIGVDASIGQALQILVDEKISSLFVRPEHADGPYGIITERDILRNVARNGTRALTDPVSTSATFPLSTVKADDFLYSAFGRMRRKRYRHLGVVDATGAIVGALTQRDLLRQRADDAIALTDALDEVSGVSDLAVIWRKLADAARALIGEDVDPRDVAAIISGEVCNLTARAAEIAEREMAEKRPDGLSFAVMVLGSGGRGESLLAMDQDNAIVFDGRGEDWLKPFAERMNAILDEIGVPFCKGGVMARNEAWRKSSAEWRKQVSDWLSRSRPADILNADIFFDALPVYGDMHLAEELRRDCVAAASGSAGFLKLMTLNAASVEPPLGWFGRFRTQEDGRMDLKRGGIMPVFSAARVLALKHGILERSSVARLEVVRGREGIPDRQIEQVLEAHKIILGIILSQQLADIEKGVPPSNRVDPKSVRETDRDRLRWALEHVKEVISLLGDPVG